MEFTIYDELDLEFSDPILKTYKRGDIELIAKFIEKTTSRCDKYIVVTATGVIYSLGSYLKEGK